MDWFAKAFIRTSLIWLTLGVTLGVAMAAHAPWTMFRPAHLHILVLGFVTMMIDGVAYHVVPRFVGAALHSRRVPVWHLFVSNVGLAIMVVGFVLRAKGVAGGAILLTTGGALSATGAYLFAYVLWRTLGATTRAQPIAIPLHRDRKSGIAKAEA